MTVIWKLVLAIVVAFCTSGVALANPASELNAEVNVARVANGLEPLVLDDELNAVAQRWADHMAATYEFRHGGGENVIARGTDTPKETAQVWLHSNKGHRAWLLGPSVRAAGWGVAVARNGVKFWAGAFRNFIGNTTVRLESTTTTQTASVTTCTHTKQVIRERRHRFLPFRCR